MERVSVSKRELEVFNRVASNNAHSKLSIMKYWFEDGSFEFSGIDFDKVIALLYGNYEVQLTPLEQLELSYSDVLRNKNIHKDKGNVDMFNYYSGYCRAMCDVADTLNLEVHFNKNNKEE